MKYWAIFSGDKEGPKLDIRNLGGHLDVTHRARAGTLAWMLFPLDFCGLSG